MFRSSKMKSKIFLNNFLIVMCVTISFGTCRPSSSDEDYDIIGKCLTEMGCEVDTIDKLNLTMAEKLRRKANGKIMKANGKIMKANRKMMKANREMMKVNEEKNKLEARLTNEAANHSLIKVAECIDGLFSDCWPKWAPSKPNGNYTKEQWQILLFNVENRRILAIRTYIEKYEISEDDFIEEAKQASELPNISDYELVMERKDKSEAVKVLDEFRDVVNPEVIKILLFGRKLTPDYLLENTVMNKANDARSKYNLLQIPNYNGPEEYIEKVLDEIYNKTSTKHNGLVVVDHAAYVTFQNFPSAYYLWDKWVHGKDTPIIQSNSVILSGSTRLKDKYDMYVNLTIYEHELAEVEYAIFKQIENTIHMPESRHTYRLKQRSTTSTIEIFYKFTSANPAIRFYSLCKKVKPGMVKFLSSFKADLIEYTTVAAILPQHPSSSSTSTLDIIK